MIKVNSIYNGKAYLETDEGLDEYNRVGYGSQATIHTSEDSDGILFVKTTDNPYLFRYGYKQKKADYFGNPAGYVWSSRPSCLNQAFGTDFINVIVGSDATLAIKASDLEKILPEEYSIIKRVNESGEISYNIVKEKPDEDK